MPTWTTKTLNVALLLALVLAACGQSDDSASGPAAASDSSPTVATTAATTAPTVEPTAAPLQAANIPVEPGDLAITRVIFGDETGDGGLVELRNVGDSQANLRFFKLCQPPTCVPLEDTLDPGQVAWLTSSDTLSLERDAGVLFVVGSDLTFKAESGEFAVFETDETYETTGIVSYVQWGDDGHGATSIAVEGGVWIEGSYLETTDANEIAAPEGGTDDPGQWTIS